MKISTHIIKAMQETDDYFGQDHRFVVELTPDDFDKTAPWLLKPGGESGSGMLLFYAPWCGYCKKVREPWADAAKISGFCDFYAFNCEKYKSHVAKIKADMPQLISGFPSIIRYQDGQPDEYYKGDRTVDALVAECMSACGDKCKKSS